MPDPKQSFAVDDRREWLRIDDTLLLEYRVVGEPYVPTSVPDAAAVEETITTFISKPTNDLLAFAQLHEGEALRALAQKNRLGIGSRSSPSRADE